MRSVLRRLLLLVVMLLGIQGAVDAQRGGLSPEEIERLSSSVVQIITLDDDIPIGSGSGTIVSPDGLIFTNRHVIEDGNDFAILILEDPNELPVLMYYAGEPTIYEDLDFATLRIDRDEDLRRIDTSALDLEHIDPELVAKAGTVARGDDVYIFGYPGVANGYMSLTSGTITTIQNGDVGDQRMPVLYQTDAEIAPGNSGGLAVTGEGVPLGIPTEVQSEGRTGARLGGILPFEAVLEMVNSGAAVVGGGGRSSTRAPGMDDEQWRCDGEPLVSNGTAVTAIQMRPGYSYRVTVIGVDDFDPVLLVIYPDGSGYCNDDSDNAIRYTATLPGVGLVTGNGTGSQIEFQQDTGEFADMQIVVGGYEGMGGEFILIVEGMGVTDADNLGDPFSVLLNRSLIASGVPITAYMLGRDLGLDPFMGLIDPEDWRGFLLDDNDDEIVCDDSGTEFCWGDSSDLSRAAVTLGDVEVAGESYDAMLAISPEVAFESDYERIGFLLTSYDQRTRGQYLLVFHMGLAAVR
ncbi:MAG: trypsin-like peptidase domain-containing protein [Anaerolinea sp.]|nr:trypsin-like peptidase domain-containing protein [Anaerolinea sp.]